MESGFSVKIINHCYTEESLTELPKLSFNNYNLDYWRGSRSYEYKGAYKEGMTIKNLNLKEIALEGCEISALYRNTGLTQFVDLDTPILPDISNTYYAISIGNPETFILDINNADSSKNEYASIKLISSDEIDDMKNEILPEIKTNSYFGIIGGLIIGLVLLLVLLKILKKRGFRININS